MKSDTSPEALRVQIDLLRKAGIDGRARLFLALCRERIEASRDVIRQVYPHLSERDRGLKFVELNYGKQLAEEVARHMERLGL